MGTNYYLKPVVTVQEQAVLDKFGLSVEPIHIGKASCGWVFLFNVIDGNLLRPYTDTIKVWENKYGNEMVEEIGSFSRLIEVITPLVENGVLYIEDESEGPTTLDALLGVIEAKKRGKSHIAEARPCDRGEYHLDKEGYEFVSWSEWS